MFANISRSKGNQITKFGHLIECNMRNIFLEKSYIKCVGETIFEEKYFSYYPLLIDQISLSGFLYFVSTGQYVYYNCLNTRF